MNFRLLQADEIECRIAKVTENGCQLLLYKDARCDMNILDETVGSMNWKRSHSRDNANCTVELWDNEKQQWVSKEDTGTESYTEKEKGLASDSFKRACFNWGIGRELYTAPFIWIPSGKCEIKPKGAGYTCNDRFRLTDIQYSGRRIVYVRVLDEKTKKEAEFGTKTTPEMESIAKSPIGKVKAEALRKMLEGKVDVEKLCQNYKVKSLEELTEEQMSVIVRTIEAKGK